MSPTIAFFQSVLGNEFGKSAKDSGLKVYTDVILYKELEGRSKVVGAAIVSGASMTDSDEFQHRLHCFGRNRVLGSDLIVVTAIVIHKDSFPISCPYELNYTTTDEVPELLEDVPEYGYYV